ncbi:hypothetical protein ACJ41O_005984 [Fusarium nematophilum]
MATLAARSDVAQARFKASPPTTTGVFYAVAAHVLFLFNEVTGYLRSFGDVFTSSEDAPDLSKSYPCRPKLPARIFIPKSYDQSSNQKLPTLFSIHGGGFVLGNARDDEPWNRDFADTHSVLVVALNYSKGPVSRFPTPIYDLEQVILAALGDSSLPIDRQRVAVAGFSAGGNLALSVSSLPSMNGSGDGVRRIQAVIPIYPVVDMSVPSDYKTQTRRYKPSLGGFRAQAADYLLRFSPVFDWAYTKHGQDLQDPLLSPIFTPRDKLPPNVFIIACELDMLSGESWRMICGLTDHPLGEERVGRDEPGPKRELILDDERYSFEVQRGNGSYKWLLIPDQIHGFDHYKQMQPLHRDNELAMDAAPKTKESQRLIAEWLIAGPFGPSS